MTTWKRATCHSGTPILESGESETSVYWLKPLRFRGLYVTALPFVAQLVKNRPAIQETWVRSPGGEDRLEKKIATHSSFLAWRIPWTEEPCGLQSMGLRESDMTQLLKTIYVTWCQLLNLSVSWIQHQSGFLPEEPAWTLKSGDWGSSKRRLFAKMQAELKDPHKEWWSISELVTVQALSLWAWDGGQAEESFHRAWRAVIAVGKSCLEGAVTFNGRLQPIQVLAGKELEQ